MAYFQKSSSSDAVAGSSDFHWTLRVTSSLRGVDADV
jgi:hypothetical protein